MPGNSANDNLPLFKRGQSVQVRGGLTKPMASSSAVMSSTMDLNSKCSEADWLKGSVSAEKSLPDVRSRKTRAGPARFTPLVRPLDPPQRDSVAPLPTVHLGSGFGACSLSWSVGAIEPDKAAAYTSSLTAWTGANPQSFEAKPFDDGSPARALCTACCIPCDVNRGLLLDDSL